jgi:DNA polymerase-3 subunit delta
MVAIKSQETEQFLRAIPSKITALLFYGVDDGLISERALAACKAIAAASDPQGEILRLDDIDLEQDFGRLATELTSVSMFGDRRIIRLNASRRVTAATIAPLLAAPLEGTLVIEAGNLKPDEGLRGLFEKSPNAAAIGCYVDTARELEGLVRAMQTSYKFEITEEARHALIARLGADRIQSRTEIEKLALYCYGKSRIELADVEGATGDASELALEAAVIAAANGQAANAVITAERVFAAGESPQALIIVSQRYFQRLHRVRSAMEATGSKDQALRSLRPPLHFKTRDAFSRQVDTWSAAKLLRALDRIRLAQQTARSSIIDDTLAASRLILDLARLAAAPDRRPGRKQS